MTARLEGNREGDSVRCSGLGAWGLLAGEAKSRQEREMGAYLCHLRVCLVASLCPAANLLRANSVA